jgi:hypothetical protein
MHELETPGHGVTTLSFLLVTGAAVAVMKPLAAWSNSAR